MNPYLQNVSTKERLPIRAFGGINTGVSPLLIEDGQAEDLLNLDTRDFPLLKTRETREVIHSLAGQIRYLGTIDDKYLAVTLDNKWKYYNGSSWVDIYNVEAENGDSTIFRGKNIYVSGSESGGYCYEGTTATRLSNMPVAHYITTNANRLYATDKTKSYLYFSDYGDSGANNWTGEGSGVIEVLTPNGEKCSGITAFNGSILFFKPHSVHELYGTGPSSYQMVSVSGDIGCISHRSIKEVARRLYWLGTDTVYMYNGGTKPADIGLEIKRFLINKGDLTKACAGSDGERYYLSLPQKDDKSILLVYDTRTGIWTAEDNSGITAFASMDGTLYGATEDGIIYKMVSDYDEVIEWHWNSKWFSSGSPSMKQNWNSIYVVVETEGAFNAEVINNKGQSSATLNRVYESVDSGLRVQRIMIPPSAGHNADWLQVRLSGVGHCKVHSIERDIRTRKGSY